jgi:nitroimidazol reductase NimA-like FMN-containing flavoprotein (pyridoxamine 5'-phosphate oxidase superfamily)
MQRDQVIEMLNDPLAQELLQSRIPARVAYTGIDGSPRVIPLGFHWNGAAFVICTAPNAPKVRALAANPAVAMTIDTESFPPRALLVRGTASLETVDGVPEEYLAASRKSVGPEQFAAFEAQVRSMYTQMVRITITPHWAKVLDFVTRLPRPMEELVQANRPQGLESQPRTRRTA